MSEYTCLAHHGVKGMHWGERKYQNADGSLTALGRVHYGVGSARDKTASAVKSVGTAIRKKVKPTNAELNAQIRKQRTKNLNKEKKRELRDLKRGIDEKASKGSSKETVRGQHKRFSEMSDEDIKNRINRLKSEIELADLERTKSMGPGMRIVDKALREAGQEALKKTVSKLLTDQGAQIVDSILASPADKKTEDTKKVKDELEARKAKKELEEFKRENPEGLGKFTPSARKAAKEKKAKDAEKKYDEELKKESERSNKRSTVSKERATRAKAYDAAGLTNAEIAKKLGISVGDVDYYLHYGKKEG